MRELCLAVLLLAMLLNFAGRRSLRTDSLGTRHDTASASPLTSLTPVIFSWPAPKEITRADLAKLRWIVGTWRGTGGDVAPFYERYKFENDSTRKNSKERLSNYADRE